MNTSFPASHAASSGKRLSSPPWRRQMLTMPRVRICSFLVLFATGLAGLADEPRLNQIQAIGSHNSYHVAPPAGVLEIVGRFHPGAAEAWNYTHPSLTRQLAAGLRQFELDVYADPDGGLFANPSALKLAASAKPEPAPFDPDGRLDAPGFKVLHVPDIDCWSNTPSLESALSECLAWSLAHPGHLPLMMLIECKDQPHPPLPTRPVPFTRERLLELEQAILNVLPREKILFPDDVRQNESALPAAIERHGWPALAAVRGKFLFALDNTDAIRDRYLEDNPSLEGRLLFVSASGETDPAAAWFKCNDPVREFDRIRRLVQAGFLVRTRADTSKPDPVMRERAFASGAQWVSTDHYSDETPQDVRVAFDRGTTVRPNPVNGAANAAISP